MTIIRSIRFHLVFIVLTLFTSFRFFGQNTDINILRKMNSEQNSLTVITSQLISDFTSLFVYLSIFILFLSGYFFHKIILRKASLFVLLSVALADLLSSLIKVIVQRDRPYQTYLDIIKYGYGGNYSFPSGHTTEAFAFATAMALTFRKWYFIIPVYTWAFLVGISRMNLGTHYPSDVLAGIILGSSSAFGIHLINKKIIKRRDQLPG